MRTPNSRHGAAVVLATLAAALGAGCRAAHAVSLDAGRGDTGVAAVRRPNLDALPLSWVRVLEVLPGGRVRIRAPNIQIDRLVGGGGVFDDRHAIQTGTGAILDVPDARPADEIVLARGEGCSIGHGPFVRVTFEGLAGGLVVLRVDGTDRGGRWFQGVLRTAPFVR